MSSRPGGSGLPASSRGRGFLSCGVILLFLVALTGCGSDGVPATSIEDPFSLDGVTLEATFPDGVHGSGSAETTYRGIASPPLAPRNTHLEISLAPEVAWAAPATVPDTLVATLDWALEITGETSDFVYVTPAQPKTVSLERDGTRYVLEQGELLLEADVGAPDASDLIALLERSGEHHAHLILVVTVAADRLPADTHLAFSITKSVITISYRLNSW